MGFLDAERACGTVLRRAKRNFFVRQRWLFDTPAPQPVAGRRRLPKRCFGSGCARPEAILNRPRNQLRGVAACRSGASARAAPDRGVAACRSGASARAAPDRRRSLTGPATSCGASPPAEAVLRLGLRPTGGDPYARSHGWTQCCSFPVSGPFGGGNLRGADAWTRTVKIINSNYYNGYKYKYIDYYMD